MSLIQLTWLQEGDDMVGFHVKETIGTGHTVVATVPKGKPGEMMVAEINISDRLVHQYQVFAYNLDGEGPGSNFVQANGQGAMPPTQAPADLQVVYPVHP